MSMTIETAAKELDCNEYGREGAGDLFAEMKSEMFVAVFGYSDDVMVMKGAIDDEFYGDVYIDHNGVIINECDCYDCPNYLKSIVGCNVIKPVFCHDVTFNCTTDIRHVKFKIMEDGDIYGYGIVFDLSDLKE